MDSIERVETVRRGGIPDRVPVDLHDSSSQRRPPGAASLTTSTARRPWPRATSPAGDARGTPEAVEAAVREELAVLAPGGGLILGPGCALPPGTPAENIAALVESTSRWARHGADGSLLAG
jgi:hypothetical protein